MNSNDYDKRKHKVSNSNGVNSNVFPNLKEIVVYIGFKLQRSKF